MTIANTVVCKLLESRAHRLMSGSTDVVRYRGRRSGEMFSTPTQYATYGWHAVGSLPHKGTNDPGGARQRIVH